MRASHRRLLFRIIFTICVTLSVIELGTGSGTRAQGIIPGLPGSASDAALGRGVGDNKLGSVLFFNYYTSNALSSVINTRISITNANPVQDIAVHVFFIDTDTCNIADAFICLTRNQTTTFVASDLDPNVTGYLIVVAVDALGRPTNFNYLAGDEMVLTPTAHRFSIQAVAAARRDGGQGSYSSPVNSDGTTSTLFFNGDQYDFLPYSMMLDSFPSQVSGVGAPLADTRLYVYTPLSNLVVGGTDFRGTLFFLIHDDMENTYSGQLPLICYLTSDKQRITSVRTSPNLNTVVPAGRTGWAKFYAFGTQTIVCNTDGATIQIGNAPLLGATATKIGNYSGGYNLRYMTTFNAPGYSITVPVIPPSCGGGIDTVLTRGSSLCGTTVE